MSRYSDQTTTRIAGVDVPLGGVQIYVYNSSDGSLATLTDAGGVPIANGNPILSDDQGNFAFYATDALYDLAFYYGGKFIYRENGVPVGLANNIVAQSVAAAVAAAQAVIASHVFTVSSASGQSVTSRALLAGISSPVNGQIATLAENGNDYVFEFSTANLSLQVAGDYLGNYVAPTGQTGSAGAWVKQASQDASAQQGLAGLTKRLAVVEDEIMGSLPTLGAGAYHAVCFMTRLIPTYSGPAFRGIRNSDGVAVDVFFTGKSIAPGDIKALRGTGSILRIDKVYDQTGNGHDLTQTVAAQRPGVHENVYVNGAPVIIIDGGANFIGGPARNNSTGAVGLDSSIAVTGHDCALFFVPAYKASTQEQALFACSGSSGGAGGRFIHKDYGSPASAAGNALIEYDPANAVYWANKHFRAAPMVIAFREKAASAPAMFINGVSTAGTASDLASPGANTTETLSAALFGYSSGLSQYNSNMHFHGWLAINGAPTDGDMISVTRALQSNVGIPSRFDSRIVVIGDSIGEGGANTNVLELMWYLRQQNVKGRPEFFNNSIAGKQLSQCYTDRAVLDASIYKTGDPVVYVIQAGTNDIHGGVSAASLYATLTSYVSYLHGLGTNVKVVVNTILKRGDNNPTQAQVVIDYNVLVRANTAGADAFNDVATEPHFAATGSESDTTIYGTDTIHPTSLGYSYLAPFYANAINTVLP